MTRLFVLGALILLATTACKKVEQPPQDTTPTASPVIGAEEEARSPRKRIPIPDDHIKLPKGHSSAGWEAGKYVELLCDPKAHRLSLNINPPEFRPDSGFPERKLMKIARLEWTHKRDDGLAFRGPNIEYLPCGSVVVELHGDSHHRYGLGPESAYGNFVSVNLWQERRLLFPRYDVGRETRLGGLALSYGWQYTSTSTFDDLGCPQGFAERLDAIGQADGHIRFDIFLGTVGDHFVAIGQDRDPKPENCNYSRREKAFPALF